MTRNGEIIFVYASMNCRWTAEDHLQSRAMLKNHYHWNAIRTGSPFNGAHCHLKSSRNGQSLMLSRTDEEKRVNAINTLSTVLAIWSFGVLQCRKMCVWVPPKLEEWTFLIHRFAYECWRQIDSKALLNWWLANFCFMYVPLITGHSSTHNSKLVRISQKLDDRNVRHKTPQKTECDQNDS